MRPRMRAGVRSRAVSDSPIETLRVSTLVLTSHNPCQYMEKQHSSFQFIIRMLPYLFPDFKSVIRVGLCFPLPAPLIPLCPPPHARCWCFSTDTTTSSLLFTNLILPFFGLTQLYFQQPRSVIFAVRASNCSLLLSQPILSTQPAPLTGHLFIIPFFSSPHSIAGDQVCDSGSIYIQIFPSFSSSSTHFFHSNIHNAIQLFMASAAGTDCCCAHY